MKYDKIFAVVILVALLFCLAACSGDETKSPDISDSSTQENTTETVLHSSESTEKGNEVTSVQIDITDPDTGGFEEEFESLFDDYKYRYIYYSVYAPFVEIVGEEDYYNWLYTEYETVEFSERNEMAMVAFIKKFNISREDFDKANEKSKTILSDYGMPPIMNPASDDPYYDRDIECREVYNADIIYTFDNELINSYYLYVDPYAEESSAEGK